MVNSTLRRIYNWKPIQWFATTTGMDYHVRKYFEETTHFNVGDVIVEVSERTIPEDVYLQPERKMLEDLISELGSNDVFWDVGADKGLYTCTTGRIISEGAVVSFEPHPVRLGQLKRNLRRNNLSTTIRTEALSDMEGEAEFAYRIEPDGEAGEFTATLTSGDELIDRNLVEIPTIIKIDVEGAELDVLRGLDETLKRDECRLVYVELHSQISDFGGTWEELEDYLRSRGFSVETIAKRIDDDYEQPYLKAQNQEDD